MNTDDPKLPDDPGKSWDIAQSEILASFSTDSIAEPDKEPIRTIGATVQLQESAQPQREVTQPGTRLILRRKLGTGGFGEVWEAVQERLGRAVAVKKVRVDLCQEKNPTDARHAFIDENLRQEALIAASLDHPNIVPVYDLQNDERGFPALAMKLVRGRAWEDVIRADRKELSMEEFLAKHIPILIGVSQAVAFAHSRGVVHRDLKPAQVMIGDFGEVLLMDWGLGIVYDTDAIVQAYEASHVDSLPTAESASSPAGTLAYMAPEQTEKSATRIGPWTDVYLLGGILYKLLTGAPPHHADTPQKTLEHARTGEVIPIRDCISEDDNVPDELIALCEWALQKEPAKRPQNGKEFLDKLLEFHSGSARRQQSRELVVEAAKLFPEAGGSYQKLSRCDELLTRARELWADNSDAVELAQTVTAEFARAATATGDLELARLLIARLPDGEEKEQLGKGVATAELQRKLRERERRIALAVIVITLVVIAAGVFYYNRRINHAQQVAVQARKDAEVLIGGLQDNLFEELRSAGQVRLLEEFGGQVDEYFSRLDKESMSRDTRVRHITSLLALQQTQARLGETSASQATAERVVKLGEQLAASEPGNQLFVALLARAKGRYAEALFATGADSSKALEIARSAASSIHSLDTTKIRDIPTGMAAARTAQDLSSFFLFLEGDTTTAAKLLSISTSIRDQLLVKFPGDESLLEGRSLRLIRSATLYLGTGKLDAAKEALDQALSIRKEREQANPADLVNRAEIARTLFWMGRVHERLGETTAAMESHRQALEIREELSARDPSDMTLRWECAASRGKIAEMRVDLGEMNEADDELSATMAILKLAKGGVQNRDFDLALASTQVAKGRVLESRGQAADARKQYEEAAGILKRLESFAPYDYLVLRYLVEANLRLDRKEEASAATAKLRHLGYKHAALDPLLAKSGIEPL